MRKATKIITILVIALLIASTVATIVLAYSPADLNASQPTDGVITGMGDRIFGIVQVVGIIISVVWLAVLGIKYMMGSTEEKAEYKKTMLPYIVGAVLVGGASWIANVVWKFSQSLQT